MMMKAVTIGLEGMEAAAPAADKGSPFTDEPEQAFDSECSHGS
jgi:hypothetical protein